METLQKHRIDKPLWSELDWLVNYKTTPAEDKLPNHKKCKLLGSILDTGNNVTRRKILVINAMRKLSYIFNSTRISIQMKTRTFQTYIAPIFLYNSELWSTNKTTKTLIDSFH